MSYFNDPHLALAHARIVFHHMDLRELVSLAIMSVYDELPLYRYLLNRGCSYDTRE